MRVTWPRLLSAPQPGLEHLPSDAMSGEDSAAITELFLNLALCHTAMKRNEGSSTATKPQLGSQLSEEKKMAAGLDSASHRVSQPKFQASSPDEVALVSGGPGALPP